jgi:2-polyprenyl-3-methyl-5-hydroxy-6-metoxy-1,4-benzoquinol methylase
MCILCEPVKIEKAGEMLVDTLNKSALSFMLSLGHQSGLLEAMKDNESLTSTGLAEKAGLNERYVREWLGAMVCSGIVEVEGDDPEYKLTPEFIYILTSEAGNDYLGHIFQYFSVLGKVEQDILKCFKNGGGVPYEAYDRFHQVMAEDSNQTVVSALNSKILKLDKDLIPKLETGAQVVDIGCGSGLAIHSLAKEFPQSNFTGLDLCQEPIEKAKQLAVKDNLRNLSYKTFDLARWNEKSVYDIITAFDVIHDQAHPDLVLKNAYNALKEDGIFLVQDIDASSFVAENKDHPLGTLLYTVSTMHCMSVSLSQNGMGLGTMWGRQKAMEMFKEAGFNSVEVFNLDHDFQNCYYLLKK